MPATSPAVADSKWDYIIIGAGSAGCVLANRLSEDENNQVLLLEAGGSHQSILVQMPTALSYPMASATYNWGYLSDAEPALDDREITCPRGKGLGGTSSINGMVYVRGHSCDFEEWETAGAKGWGYANCLPYFKRAETWQFGEDEYRGGSGPLGVGGGNNMKANPLYQAFIDAGKEAGYPATEDYNGYRQEGFGPMHMTVQGGVRESTERAYLKPAKSRSNLTIWTGAFVDRILLENGRASAVILTHKNSQKRLSAAKEIILSAGSIASPAILERSGIGSKSALKAAGVELLHERPGVGENLQDHLEIYFQYHCTKPVSLNNKLGLLSKLLIGVRWFFFKSGLGATNHFESCAFIRSDAGLKSPDIQYHFLPAAMRYDGTPSIDGHGFQVHVGPNKPKSRGHVHIRSADPLAPPSIKFNYMQHPEDVAKWRKCIRLSREIIGQPALDAYRGEELQPGDDIQSDDQIDAWVQENVESAYHPCGTCKMGLVSDPMAVVDPECRVIGLDGLRIVDASVFPTVTNGNINAPTIMVAERASDIILNRPLLPASSASSWIDENWQTQQRSTQAVRIHD
ncbi:choline dehydrogenase [Sphingomonadales bacterium EhC05]|nr:choline dehydrogenase [Sphingomonadales bacterium EhC05]